MPTNEEARLLFGAFDEHLRWIEEELPVRLVSRGNVLTISGTSRDQEIARAVLDEILARVRSGEQLTKLDVRRAVRDQMLGFERGDRDIVVVTHRGKPIRAKSRGQAAYVEAMRKYDIVFGIGPAGTGKTYLAMAMAVAALKERQVSRIILTRPAVEAGEKLGFLPGDLQEKVDPYLRPLYDAMFDILGIEAFEKHRERGMVEVAPLAYMRGRTLDDSFIILDEAQNTTPEQMKMFLTRLGFGSKAVITGDVTQIDLPRGQYSGLEQAREILRGVEGIAFAELDEHDVVRHELVQKIIKAYERAEEREREKERERERERGRNP